jgi:hypothetical protein
VTDADASVVARVPPVGSPLWLAVVSGLGVGLLGGLVGLGGAVPAPLLIGLFGSPHCKRHREQGHEPDRGAGRHPSRLLAVPLADVASRVDRRDQPAGGLACGGVDRRVLGDADASRRLRVPILQGIAVVFAAEHVGAASVPTIAQAIVGVAAGFVSEVVAAIMGVAGGNR